jgi:hypothetical protein
VKGETVTTYFSFQFRMGANAGDPSDRPFHKEVILTATPKALPTWRWRDEVTEKFQEFLDDVERLANRERWFFGTQR